MYYHHTPNTPTFHECVKIFSLCTHYFFHLSALFLSLSSRILGPNSLKTMPAMTTSIIFYRYTQAYTNIQSTTVDLDSHSTFKAPNSGESLGKKKLILQGDLFKARHLWKHFRKRCAHQGAEGQHTKHRWESTHRNKHNFTSYTCNKATNSLPEEKLREGLEVSSHSNIVRKSFTDSVRSTLQLARVTFRQQGVWTKSTAERGRSDILVSIYRSCLKLRQTETLTITETSS